MVEEIKTMLGEAAANFTDAQISLCLKFATAEVEAYCRRELDTELEIIAQRIAIIKLNRINTEGLASQAYSGISESYTNGYPEDIVAVLNSKRKIKVI
jgi:hypothetical protein